MRNYTRRRLESYLQSKGYDADVLARLGEISYEMHDSYAAGRAWLLSSSEGKHVDGAIDVFVKHAGLDPQQVVGGLYRSAWPKDLDACSPIVQARVGRLGLAEVLARGPQNINRREVKVSWGERVFMVTMIGVVLFCLSSCCVGATKIFSWVFGGD